MSYCQIHGYYSTSSVGGPCPSCGSFVPEQAALTVTVQSPIVRRTTAEMRSYLQGFRAGAEAVLSFIAGEWPDMAEEVEDNPSPVDAAREQIDATVRLIEGTRDDT